MTHSTDQPPVDEEEVRALARLADLPLDPDRVPAVTALLAAWLPGVNDLSRVMRSDEYRETLPITVFAHPHTDSTE